MKTMIRSILLTSLIIGSMHTTDTSSNATKPVIAELIASATLSDSKIPANPKEFPINTIFYAGMGSYLAVLKDSKNPGYIAYYCPPDTGYNDDNEPTTSIHNTKEEAVQTAFSYHPAYQLNSKISRLKEEKEEKTAILIAYILIHAFILTR